MTTEVGHRGVCVCYLCLSFEATPADIYPPSSLLKWLQNTITSLRHIDDFTDFYTVFDVVLFSHIWLNKKYEMFAIVLPPFLL